MKAFKLRVPTGKDIDVPVSQQHRMFKDIRPRTAAGHRVGDRAHRR